MSKNYYNTLKAGSEVVSLRIMSPYVYENAIKLAENMTEDKAEEAMRIYQQVFIERFTKLIIEHSNNASQTEQFSGVTKKFTILEKEIFDLHKKQKLRFQAWKNREGPSIEVNQEFLNQGEQAGPGKDNNLKRFKAQWLISLIHIIILCQLLTNYYGMSYGLFKQAQESLLELILTSTSYLKWFQAPIDNHRFLAFEFSD